MFYRDHSENESPCESCKKPDLLDENYFAWELYIKLKDQCIITGMGEYIGINSSAFINWVQKVYEIYDDEVIDELWRKIQVIDGVRKQIIEKHQNMERQKNKQYHSSGGSKYHK